MKNLFFLITFVLTQFAAFAQNSPYAFLGVYSNQVDSDKAEKLNFDVPHGAYLTRITPNTAADKAGLEVFDYIYRIGEYDLTEDMSLGRVMKQYEPGDEVTLYHYRGGKKMESVATLGSNWENTGYHRSDDEDPFLGVHETHNNTADIDGAPVNVSSNSTAEAIGMEDGDIVTKVDDVPIFDWHDLAAAINNRSAGDNISVTVWRNGQELTFNGPIKPESSRHDSDWSWDWDWKWTWENDPESEEMDISDMDVEVSEMNAEELETAMEETGLDMPKVNNLTIEAVNVFPNPSMGMFTIDFDLPESGSTRINIFSGTGQLVFSRNLGEYQGNFSENLDVAGAGPGIYYLMVQQNDFAVTRKIVVSGN